MKKTIIALMALAGIAAAADSTLTAQFTAAPVVAGNCWSGDYTLSFILGDGYTMENTGTVIAFYRGSAINDTHGYNAIVLGGTNDALTLTVGRGRAYNTESNATAIDADTTFTFADSVTFTTAIQKGVEYTLTVTGGDQAMAPTLTWADGSETLASYKGNMNGNAALTYAVNPGVTIVPEPATATLSLLALAGLAARRRRK